MRGRRSEFYKNAFGARELMRFEAGDRIAHAELAIGNAMVMLGEEAPEYGFPGPEALGGSPVGMHLDVEDVNAFVDRAVAAGARLVNPVTDQFYGERSGSVQDPFGYTWSIATRTEDLSVDEMHRRMEGMQREKQASRTAPTFIPKGFRSVTPYLIVQDAPALIEFAKNAFGAEETFRTESPGGMHAEIRIGDSMVMIGGGGSDLAWRGQQWPTALHLYVEDTDAAYERAVRAGATPIQPPADSGVRRTQRRRERRARKRVVYRDLERSTPHPERVAHRQRLSASFASRAADRLHATRVRGEGHPEVRLA